MIKLSTFNTVALTKIDAAFPEKPACVLADHFQAFKNKLSIAISCLACLSAFREKLIDCNEAATWPRVQVKANFNIKSGFAAPVCLKKQTLAFLQLLDVQFYILSTKGDSLSRTSIRYSYPDPFRRSPPNDWASSRKRRSNQHAHQFMSEQMRCFHRQRLHQALLHLLGHYPMSDHSKQQQALSVHNAIIVKQRRAKQVFQLWIRITLSCEKQLPWYSEPP